MTNRVALGQFPDGGYGLRVADAGYDVLSNPVDNSRLLFSSDWPSMFPVHFTDSFNLAANTSVTKSYTDLGFIPFGMWLWYDISTSRWRPGIEYATRDRTTAKGVRFGRSSLVASGFTSATTIAYAVFRKKAFDG